MHMQSSTALSPTMHLAAMLSGFALSVWLSVPLSDKTECVMRECDRQREKVKGTEDEETHSFFSVVFTDPHSSPRLIFTC